MSDTIKIAVDAMGGDGSPKKVIDGIIHNYSKEKDNFYKIIGDREQILPLINNKIVIIINNFFNGFNFFHYYTDFPITSDTFLYPSVLIRSIKSPFILLIKFGPE